MSQRPIERRATAGRIEVRTAEDGTLAISGYAAVFDSEAYGEVVRRSAFTKTLAESDDVKLLVNHEGVPIARTKSGTLSLSVDDRGLRVQADGLDPVNPTVIELCSALARGDIDQMSFAFTDMQRSVTDDGLRELKQVRLHDVSIVTTPWYEDTTVELNGRLLAEARSGRPNRDGLRELARMLAPAQRALNGWTLNDALPLLLDAFEDSLPASPSWYWCYVLDISDTWVVFVVYSDDRDLYQCDYELDASGVVTLGPPMGVVAKTTYLPADVADPGDPDNDAPLAPDVEMDSAPEEDIEARDAWLAELWRAETSRVA